MPEISVIVPVYKTPKEYLDKCVESIVGQTVKDIELILIDDGSPDECGRYCDEYAKTDSRIKVIHQKNSGVSAARNAGIEAAQGNWIAFVDSDDWLDENAFEYALKYADGNDMVIWCTYLEEENKTLEGYYFLEGDIDFSGKDKDRLAMKAIYRHIFPEERQLYANLSTVWGRLIRTAVIKTNKIIFNREQRLWEDLIFNLYTYEYAQNIKYIGKCMYHYRTVYASACRSVHSDAVDTVGKTLDEIKKYIVKFNKDERYMTAFYLRVFDSVYGLLVDYFYADKKYRKSRTEELKRMLENEDHANALKNVRYKQIGINKKIILFLLRHRLYFLSYLCIYIRGAVMPEKNKY